MLKPDLPAKYYLDHFFEFLKFIEINYRHLLEERHISFINKFRALPEEAQCVFVRMVNRKNEIFSQHEFSKYIEIGDHGQALLELADKSFTRPLRQIDVGPLINYLTKQQIATWLKAHGLSFSNGLSRLDLVSVANANRDRLELSKLNIAPGLIVQEFTDELRYLMFVMFGQIQKSLTLYTLRDLGIRKTNSFKQEFKPRFLDAREATIEYFFAQTLDELENESSPKDLMTKILSFENLTNSSQILKDLILLNIGQMLSETDPENSVLALRASHHVLAREKLARLLYRSERKDEAHQILKDILESPRSIEELLFAEDFLERKFNKKRIGSLSEILNQARKVVLSDFYLKKPELGVQEHYQKLSYRTHFTENYLWLSLFGILFWRELFESESSAIHSPFERGPADLGGISFYQNHQLEIENKLANLKQPVWFEGHLASTITAKYGELNNVFSWHPSISETLLHFFNCSRDKDLALILRSMAKNFEDFSSGFPDLMIEKDETLKFIEVKAEGDSLRLNQLAKLRLLREAGFDVEVLKVKWQTDPDQTYVVIDVETTGGQAQFHRVTEVGAVKIKNGQIIDEFHTLINPGRPIPKFISQLTHITNEMVAKAPTFSEIADSLKNFFEGAIFVAHNVNFDYSFIQKEFRRCDLDFVRPLICTRAKMKKHFPGLNSYGLKNLSEHFQISLVDHHRALSDARAAAQLFLLVSS